MKDLEKCFFNYCCKKHMYLSYGDYDKKYKNYSLLHFGGLAKTYAKENDCSVDRLIYYLFKWSDRGVIDYGVNIIFAWFEFDKLKGEYREEYLYNAKKQLNILCSRAKSRPYNNNRNAIILAITETIHKLENNE